MPSTPPPIPTPATRKATPETLLALVELISGGVFSVGRQAEALCVHPSTLRKWLVRSNANPSDPDFLVAPWGEPMPLAKACVIARRLGYAEMRARAEERTFGVWRDTLYGGQRQPARDPEAMACPPELREILGYHKDAWLIVDGKVQWEREWIEPPVSLLEKFFTTFPDLTPTTKQQITLNGQMNVGVGIVSRGRYEGPVPTVPPEPVEHPLPEVEIVPTLPAPTSASITDQDLEDLLGPELVAPERAAIAATAATKAVAAIEPEEPPTPALAPAMAKEPEPAAPAPASSPTAPDPDASVLNGPSQPVITELQRSLLAKLEEARARRKAEQEQKS